VTGTFKANNPYNPFLLVVYGILLKLSMFLYPVIPQTQQTDGFLFKILLVQLAPVGQVFPLVYPIITFGLLYTQAISFNKLVNDHRLMPKANYLTAMSYLLITSLFKEWNILSAPLIINSLLIWVWARMSGLYGSQNPKTSLFNIGIAIGLATFFYFPSITFTAMIIFGLLVTGRFKAADWLIAFMGILTPYYFLLSWAFLSGRLQKYKFPGISLSLPHFDQTTWEITAMAIVLFAAAVGIFFIRKNFLRQLIQARKSWNLVFIYCAVAVFIPFINATHTFEYWILCAVPLSAFIGAAFLYPNRNWFPAILHWLMVAFVIAFSYFVR
jgi:hypothetical protein